MKTMLKCLKLYFVRFKIMYRLRERTEPNHFLKYSRAIGGRSAQQRRVPELKQAAKNNTA